MFNLFNTGLNVFENFNEDLFYHIIDREEEKNNTFAKCKGKTLLKCNSKKSPNFVDCIYDAW